MRFEIEWQEAPGVRDKVLAATWATLSLRVGNLCASEAISERSKSRRTGIDGSLFPLAEWLVEHWWHLLHEPSPWTPVPGGRADRPWMHSWLQRHNLLAARDGGALPDLTILRDGDDVLLHWQADPVAQTPARIRFVGQGSQRVPVADLERSMASFVEAVLARSEEALPGNEDIRRVADSWFAIRSAEPSEAALCQALAVMGVDPYDPDEANDPLIEVVERCLQVLPGELRSDLFEGSDALSLQSNLAWLEHGRLGLCNDLRGAQFPTVSPVSASAPHEIGYQTAQRVRKELLGLAPDAPLPDLASALVDRLGWAARSPRLAPAQVGLEGMVGLDKETSAPVLVTAASRSERAERFRLARAAFFPVSNRLGTAARLLTQATTPPQRAARAFAAELLAPAAALAHRVGGRVSDQNVEDLAAEFLVSPQVIVHQIENHGLGYVEA